MDSRGQEPAVNPLILAPASCQHRHPGPETLAARRQSSSDGRASAAGSVPEQAASAACLAPVHGDFRVLADDSLPAKMSPSSRRYDSTGSEHRRSGSFLTVSSDISKHNQQVIGRNSFWFLLSPFLHPAGLLHGIDHPFRPPLTKHFSWTLPKHIHRLSIC